MELKSFPFIRQADMMECGTTCLAIIFKYYGYYDIRNFLTQYAQVDTEGIDLFTLSELAEEFGFETDGYQLTYDELREVALPCIAHYEGNHFVVIYKASDKKVWIADPATGKYSLDKTEFLTKWNGIVLELRPSKEVFKQNEIVELANIWRERRKKIWKAFYKASLLGTSKYLKWIIWSTVFLLGLNLMLPFFTQSIIDNVISNRNVKLLFAILIGMTGVFIIQVILTYFRNIFLTQFKIEYERNFFGKFFQHAILLPQSFYDKHKKEDFINRFSEHIKIRDFFNPAVLEELVEVVFIPIYIIVLFAFNVSLGLIVLLCIVLIGVSLALFTPRLLHLEALSFDEKSKTVGRFLDIISGIQTVKLLHIEKLSFWKWKSAYTRSLNKALETEKTQISLNIVSSALTLICQALVYWYGAYLAFQGEISLGIYVAFITVFSMVMASILDLKQLWLMFSELSVSVDKINDIFSEPLMSRKLTGHPILPENTGLSISNLSFKYSDRQEDWTLEDITMEIAQGEFVGLVGRNGCGKSTLAKLIAGLYQNYEGEITVGRVNLKEATSVSIKKRIALFPQEVYIFDGSIRENILLGNPDANEEELDDAVRLAGLTEFVQSNFLGLNLMVGEGGSNLSGGLRLRIAFARLFLMNPGIIVLDEANSALDMESEQLIMRNLRIKFPNATIISIVHRLQTLLDATNIFVMDKGKIVESGTHDQLLLRKDIYHKFYHSYVGK